MRPKVYIDGQAGTTGLRIRDWLARRADLELLALPESQRRDPAARRELMRAADIAILCLPDDAAREAVAWLEGARTRVIDASTAHRVAEGWSYGLPELAPGQRELIAHARWVANPGCYASAFILLVRPLIDAALLSPDGGLSVHALSGYSGGGRAMIERWEDPAHGLHALPYEAPYALGRVHKHIPEMVKFARLRAEPQFLPAVGAFRCGMRVQVALPAAVLPRAAGGAEAIWEALRRRYAQEPFVRVHPLASATEPDERSFDPQACNDTNRIELRVLAHPSGHVLLMAVLDNLGKGACGVAIQSLNLMVGAAETSGLAA